jgi:hypothetical protein
MLTCQTKGVFLASKARPDMNAAHCRMMNDVDLAQTDEPFCDFQLQRLPPKNIER